MIDKAVKDKNHKKLDKNFRVEVEMNFIDVYNEDEPLNLEDDKLSRLFQELADVTPNLYRPFTLFD